MAMRSVFKSLTRIRGGQGFVRVAALMAALCVMPALAAEVERAHYTVEPGARILKTGPGSLRVDGSSWAARVDLGLPASSEDGVALRRPGWQLLGDYYFSAIGGLRATGGLLGSPARATNLSPSLPATRRLPARHANSPGLGEMAARGRLWPGEGDTSTATYLGLGYSTGSAATGWGLSADLGLLALREAVGVRLGSDDNTSADWPQTLRLRPMLQVGVSYSF
jgi:hypothetical protein